MFADLIAVHDPIKDTIIVEQIKKDKYSKQVFQLVKSAILSA